MFPTCLVFTETVITIHRNEVKHQMGIKEPSGHGPFHGEILPENSSSRNYREAQKTLYSENIIAGILLI